MAEGELGKVALVFRGTPEMRAQMADGAGRLGPLQDAMRKFGLAAESAVYFDEAIDEVRAQLLRVDGVLVWVDPVADGGDRSQLDPLLRELASQGIWVSTHPDVILKMGTKEVLVETKSLGWGTDCHLCWTLDHLRAELPARLASGETRVLKQYRGNGGIGVYRVALAEPAADGRVPPDDAIVHTQHARFGSEPEDMTIGEFISRMQKHFEGQGRMIDQPYQTRLPEGMIRVYFTRDRVVGYGQQLIKALLPPPAEGPTSQTALPGPRVMHAADAAPFHALRELLESDWVPGMQRLLDLPTDRLPVIWDADFLYGPKTPSGEDTYVLCEINVSAVFPFPDSAILPVCEATAQAIAAAKRARARQRD